MTITAELLQMGATITARGCPRKPRLRCRHRRASGQGLWEGAKKAPCVTKRLAPEAVGGRWPG